MLFARARAKDDPDAKSKQSSDAKSKQSVLVRQTKLGRLGIRRYGNCSAGVSSKQPIADGKPVPVGANATSDAAVSSTLSRLPVSSAGGQPEVEAIQCPTPPPSPPTQVEQKVEPGLSSLAARPPWAPLSHAHTNKEINMQKEHPMLAWEAAFRSGFTAQTPAVRRASRLSRMRASLLHEEAQQAADVMFAEVRQTAKPLTTHFLLLTTYYSLLTTHYWLFTTHYSLLTTHYSLLTTHYSLLTTHYPLFTTHYSLLTTHYSLLTTHYSLLTTHYSLRTTHYPLLTTHYLLLTTY